MVEKEICSFVAGNSPDKALAGRAGVGFMVYGRVSGVLNNVWSHNTGTTRRRGRGHMAFPESHTKTLSLLQYFGEGGSYKLLCCPQKELDASHPKTDFEKQLYAHTKRATPLATHVTNKTMSGIIIHKRNDARSKYHTQVAKRSFRESSISQLRCFVFQLSLK